jgi:hypothetical protein
MRVLALLAISLLVAACSTKTVKMAPAENLLSKKSPIVLNVHGDTIAPGVLADLTRYTKAKLIIAGFDIETPSPDAIRLDVDVQTFEPGNAALRISVGFGAGRGSLIYTARYLDSGGAVLAELEGQERFTGGEVSYNLDYGQASTLMGAERVQSVLVQEAAKHIVELGLGDVEKPAARKRSAR